MNIILNMGHIFADSMLQLHPQALDFLNISLFMYENIISTYNEPRTINFLLTSTCPEKYLLELTCCFALEDLSLRKHSGNKFMNLWWKFPRKHPFQFISIAIQISFIMSIL